MKSGKFFLGILAGTAAGATLGLLFAPKKGKAMRKSLVGKGEDYVGAVKDKLDDLFGDISNKYEKAKGELGGLTKKGKAQMKEEIANANNSDGFSHGR